MFVEFDENMEWGDLRNVRSLRFGVKLLDGEEVVGVDEDIG
ncbi:hypothetical protein [Cronobacter sakazakii]|nr:hypothetical protein [Cronobacter sakazakii]